jgi:hypothetical protein
MEYENKPLDEDEKAIMDEIKSPDFDFTGDPKLLETIIASTMMENLSEEDKKFMKEESKRLGVPYPIMLSSAIHQFVEMNRKKKKEVS